MTSAVAYMRCSGEGQVAGDTWSRQQESISKYADANGVHIAHWFKDEAVTGKMELEGRVGLSECVAMVRDQGITLVIVEDSTRLARDLIVAEVCIREFQKLGVRVIAAAGGVDLTAGDDSNPTAKLIRQILAAVSEFDRCCINLKLRGARERIKAAQGNCEGRKYFGFHPAEKPVLDTMRRLRTVEGYTFAAIADALNADGIPSRMGGSWKVGTVARILGRS